MTNNMRQTRDKRMESFRQKLKQRQNRETEAKAIQMMGRKDAAKDG